MQGRFHPARNVSPASPLDRLLARAAGIGLAVVATALVAGALAGWILLTLAVAGWLGHAATLLAVLVVVAMSGLALAMCAGSLWAVLQIGSVRRALGLR